MSSALARDGAAAALLEQAAAAAAAGVAVAGGEAGETVSGGGWVWARRCWLVCHLLACSDETGVQQQMLCHDDDSVVIMMMVVVMVLTTGVQQQMLSLGVLPAAASLGRGAAASDEQTALLHALMVGALTWACPASTLRAEARLLVASHRIHDYLIDAAGRHPGALPVRLAALKALSEMLLAAPATPATPASDERLEAESRFALSFLDSTPAAVCEEPPPPATPPPALFAAVAAATASSAASSEAAVWQQEDLAAADALAAALVQSAACDGDELIAREAGKARVRLGGAEAARRAATQLAPTALGRMAASEKWREALRRSGAHAAVVTALRRGQNDSSYCAALCGVLAQLSCGEGEQSALLATEAVPLLVEMYEDALLGIDSVSSTAMGHIGTLLSNCALGALSSRDALVALGAEEATLQRSSRQTKPLCRDGPSTRPAQLKTARSSLFTLAAATTDRPPPRPPLDPSPVASPPRRSTRPTATPPSSRPCPPSRLWDGCALAHTARCSSFAAATACSRSSAPPKALRRRRRWR